MKLCVLLSVLLCVGLAHCTTLPSYIAAIGGNTYHIEYSRIAAPEGAKNALRSATERRVYVPECQKENFLATGGNSSLSFYISGSTLTGSFGYTVTATPMVGAPALWYQWTWTESTANADKTRSVYRSTFNGDTLMAVVTSDRFVVGYYPNGEPTNTVVSPFSATGSFSLGTMVGQPRHLAVLDAEINLERLKGIVRPPMSRPGFQKIRGPCGQSVFTLPVLPAKRDEYVTFDSCVPGYPMDMSNGFADNLLAGYVCCGNGVFIVKDLWEMAYASDNNGDTPTYAEDALDECDNVGSNYHYKCEGGVMVPVEAPQKPTSGK